MVRCVAFGCSNVLTKGCGVSFYKFPKDRNRRSAWEHYCRRADFTANDSSSLCSEHFSMDMFAFHPLKFDLGLSFKKRPTLLEDAVPDVPLRLQKNSDSKGTVDVNTNAKERSAVVKRRRSEVLNAAFKEFEPSVDDTTVEDEIHSPVDTNRPTENGDKSCQVSVDQCHKYIQANVGVSQRTRRIQVRPLTSSTGTQCNIINAPPLLYLSEYFELEESSDDEMLCDEADVSSSFDGTFDSYSELEQTGTYDPDYSIDSDQDYDIDSGDDFSDECDNVNDMNYMLSEDSSDITSQKQFLVSESALCEILSDMCRTCGSKCNTFVKFSKGTFICTASVCQHGHVYEWRNQKCHYGMPWSNLLVSGAVCFSGSSFSKVLRLFENMNLQMMCRRTYQYIQSAYLLPSVNSVWQNMQHEMLRSKTGQSLILGGDGRCDSPGYSAKYGSYSLLDLETNKVLDVQLVQSNEVKGSTHMELEGLKRGMQRMDTEDITVGTLVTDRHVMVKKYMKEEHTSTKHNFDVWHVSKGVSKKLEACAKKKDGEPIRPWIKSLANHMYWTAMTSGDDADLKLAKWNSIVNHIVNQHSEHSEIFPECQHGECDREWLEKGSRQHKMVKAVVQSPYLLRDIGKLSPLYQTYGLEVFHSVVNHFAPKSNHFFYPSMLARLYIAAMHYNENSNKARAVTRDGVEQWQVSFPKAKKGKEAVVKPCKVQPTCEYVHLLLQGAVERRIQMPSYRQAITESHDNMGIIPPPLTASYQAFDKEELIESHKSRFT